MRRAASRERISSRKSGMALSGDAPDGFDERVPAPALRVQVFATGRRDAIEPAAALARLFDPPPFDQASVLESVQEWVEAGDVKLEYAARQRRDALGQVVSV